MKRKIFSKLLMGALLVASVSSFTSCKDYDDDINSLKESVAKAALQSNLDALTTQVNGIKTTADNALSTANAAATKSELSAAKTEALAKAAEGITNAATAQEAADAAKKLAQEAKDAVAAIDLSPYAKTTDVDGKIAEAAANAQTAIQAALENYVLASALETRLAALKQEIADANEEQMTEMKTKVDNAVEGVKSIWGAITSISVFKASSDAAPALTIKYGRVNSGAFHFTSQVGNGKTAAKTSTWSGDATFGKKDYYNFKESSSKWVAGKNTKADQSVTYTHGDFVRPITPLIVRVSPANADLSAASVSFLNTAGGNLNDFLEVASVEPYKDQVAVSRAGSVTGLWKVNIRLKDGVLASNFRNTTTNAPAGVPATKYIYAITVNNTTAEAEGRAAVSEYDITFANPQAYAGLDALEGSKIYTVPWDKKAISDYSARVITTGTAGQNKSIYNDYVWDAPNNVPATTTAPAYSAMKIASNSKTTAFPVNNGQTFYVEAAQATKDNVQYVYVIRDDANANVSNDDSELNAWNTYTYTGVGQLIEGTTAAISVTMPDAPVKGDEIAFRLFAVNYDGTLADPDGLPFNVHVGSNLNGTTVAHTFTATQETGLVVYVPMNGSEIKANKRPDSFAEADVDGDGTPDKSVRKDVAFNNPAWPYNTYNTAKYVEFGAGVGNDFVRKSKWSDVTIAKVTFSATDLMAAWPDNGVGTNTIGLMGSDGKTIDWTITLNLTKALPTADDAKNLYTWREGQNKNGVWKAIVYPTAAGAWNPAAFDWTTAATVAMQGVNNGIGKLVKTSGTTFEKAYINPNFIFTFANSAADSNGNWTKLLTVKSDSPATPVLWKADGTAATAWNNTEYAYGYNIGLTGGDLTKIVDNTTNHASTINYSFGRVSSENYTQDVATDAITYLPYILKVEDFNTVYACAYDDISLTINPYKGYKDADDKVVEQKWNYVYYDNAVIALGMHWNATNDIRAGYEINGGELVTYNMISVSSKLGAAFVTKDWKAFTSHFKNLTAKFVSNGTLEEDYFTVAIDKATGTITLTKNAVTNDPGYDIESTIKITGECPLGHKHTWSLPFTVKTTAQ